MARPSTARFAPCWMPASKPTSPRWTWPPKRRTRNRRRRADGSANPETKGPQLDEGEFAHLGDFSRDYSGYVALFRRARGLARQANQENRRRNGQGEKGGKTQGAGETQGR